MRYCQQLLSDSAREDAAAKQQQKGNRMVPSGFVEEYTQYSGSKTLSTVPKSVQSNLCTAGVKKCRFLVSIFDFANGSSPTKLMIR